MLNNMFVVICFYYKIYILFFVDAEHLICCNSSLEDAVMKNLNLIQEQLGPKLEALRPLLDVSSPPKGWIRAIRDALGMNAQQLAKRTGMAQQRIAVIEKAEQTGAVTLKTMRRIAEGLNCVFVCGFVPKSSLKTTVRDRAEQVAAKRLSQVSHTMGLENQALDEPENQTVFSETVKKLLQKPSRLWDEL